MAAATSVSMGRVLVITALSLLVFMSSQATADEFQEFLAMMCKLTAKPDLCIKSLGSYGASIKHDPAIMATTSVKVTHELFLSLSQDFNNYAPPPALMQDQKNVLNSCKQRLSEGTEALKVALMHITNAGQAPKESTDKVEQAKYARRQVHVGAAKLFLCWSDLGAAAKKYPTILAKDAKVSIDRLGAAYDNAVITKDLLHYLTEDETESD